MKKEHGLKVVLLGGDVVWEKNNYWSDKFNRVLATNWSEIDKAQIKSLSLYWKGKLLICLDKDEVLPDTWLFSHTGMLQTGHSQNVQVLSRNIGFEKNGSRYLFKVIEESGSLITENSII